MDNRLKALEDWLRQVLDVTDCTVRPASADASFRRYFRVTADGRTYIAMDAPPDKEGLDQFIKVADRFGGLGLNVPRILEQDLEQGFLLITDLGERLYLRHLNETTVERLYGDAMGALIVLQAGIFTDAEAGKTHRGDKPSTAANRNKAAWLPDYDEGLLRREMELFREWYLGRHLGLTLTASQHAILDKMYELLTHSALEQPKVWVHRDYHSRNLMVTDANNPGILDFQDAVCGPVTYDLVSLLRDCYIAWPRHRVEDWAKGYRTLALQSGVPVCEDEALFLRWFDLMGVQRHLKASGIFARLNHRDGKPGYLKDIPRTLGYVLETSARREELKPLHALLRELKVPVAV